MGKAALFPANGLTTGGCLFASGHLKPVVNTSMHSGLDSILSCPLPSSGYTLHLIGRSFAVIETNLVEGVDRFAQVRGLLCE